MATPSPMYLGEKVRTFQEIVRGFIVLARAIGLVGCANSAGVGVPGLRAGATGGWERRPRVKDWGLGGWGRAPVGRDHGPGGQDCRPGWRDRGPGGQDRGPGVRERRPGGRDRGPGVGFYTTTVGLCKTGRWLGGPGGIVDKAVTVFLRLL